MFNLEIDKPNRRTLLRINLPLFSSLGHLGSDCFRLHKIFYSVRPPPSPPHVVLLCQILFFLCTSCIIQPEIRFPLFIILLFCLRPSLTHCNALPCVMGSALVLALRGCPTFLSTSRLFPQRQGTIFLFYISRPRC